MYPSNILVKLAWGKSKAVSIYSYTFDFDTFKNATFENATFKNATFKNATFKSVIFR